MSTDEEFEALILATVAAEPRPVSLEKIASAAGGKPSEKVAWRALLRRIKQVVAKLCDEGRLVVTRKGKPVDIRDTKGVLRVSVPSGDPLNKLASV
ncbi:MAG: DUF3253 domain-containing protein [Rhodospirillaceae bacterium]|jgi:hypothetical protein|nr:DUF3253 domain-containing protein [Rhodospirillaceae bacterium]MBT6139857.1 DUF3253 domain-containing protein [Rhodospirillaceae bacterium]